MKKFIKNTLIGALLLVVASIIIFLIWLVILFLAYIPTIVSIILVFILLSVFFGYMIDDTMPY